MLFANENLFISDNGLFCSPFSFVFWCIKIQFKPPFPGFQTTDNARILWQRWISGESQSLQSIFTFLLLISNKIKTAYVPLDKIGLREIYQTLTKNELGLSIIQLDKGSPFENLKFLFELEKKRKKEKSTILNYAFESNCSEFLRTGVKVFNSSLYI